MPVRGAETAHHGHVLYMQERDLQDSVAAEKVEKQGIFLRQVMPGQVAECRVRGAASSKLEKRSHYLPALPAKAGCPAGMSAMWHKRQARACRASSRRQPH